MNFFNKIIKQINFLKAVQKLENIVLIQSKPVQFWNGRSCYSQSAEMFKFYAKQNQENVNQTMG